MATKNRFFAHIAWSTGAPTLTEGSPEVNAPGNPAAGQIQVNLAALYSGAKLVHGSAGPNAWQVVVKNTTGLIEIQDNAGAAVAFGSTTGFVVLTILAGY